ncbi:MAG: LytTR family transcriptional regulator [Lachnospiraceae bacterium]|nr:LytTR family transcriptional regulator [Lachnospiraceae bacterium]
MRTLRVTLRDDAPADLGDLAAEIRRLPFVEEVFPEEDLRQHFTGFRDNQYHIIDWGDGRYITVEGRHTVLYTKDGSYFLRGTLDSWEETLSSHGWFRSHRAFLMNLSHVVSVSPMVNSTMNILMDGCPEKIPVSRSYSCEFRKRTGL